MFKNIQKLTGWRHMLFVLLIGFAVVAFWRGVWGLMDLYVFPDNETLSYAVSALIGFVILWVTHYADRELL